MVPTFALKDGGKANANIADEGQGAKGRGTGWLRGW